MKCSPQKHVIFLLILLPGIRISQSDRGHVLVHYTVCHTLCISESFMHHIRHRHTMQFNKQHRHVCTECVILFSRVFFLVRSFPSFVFCFTMHPRPQLPLSLSRSLFFDLLSRPRCAKVSILLGIRCVSVFVFRIPMILTRFVQRNRWTMKNQQNEKKEPEKRQQTVVTVFVCSLSFSPFVSSLRITRYVYVSRTLYAIIRAYERL